MRQNPPRYQPPGGLDVYWRRRVFALAVCLSLLGLLAWAVNGTLRPPTQARTASVTRAAGKHAGRAAGQRPAPARQQQAPARQQQAPAATAARSGRPAQPRAAGPGSCPASDVVLSLVTPEHVYRAGAWPLLEAYVVNAGRRPCRFNVGTRFLAVVVRSGPARVWDSADCASRRHASRQVRLARGVPAVLRVPWNGKRSFPGCHPEGGPARPGHYSAALVSGQLRSKPVHFVLRGRATSGP